MLLNFTDFHFLRPLWFGLLIPLAVLAWRLFRTTDAAGVWQSVCDEALLPFLLVQRTVGRSPINLGIFILGGLAAIIALAGPTWERLPTPVFRDESALVLLLDLSRSMNATDISPSRLERAKFKITDILRQRTDGQTALIVYAGEPYVVTPLTSDVVTIESQLPVLRTNIMPSQGSSAAAAIDRGANLLTQGGTTNGDLLLVTDGLQLTEFERAKDVINDTGIRLSILGIGTTDGAPIPDGNGGFVKDVGGNIVIESLRPTKLRELAAISGGVYQSVRSDDKDIEVFLRSIDDGFTQRNTVTTDRFANRWREFGPWLLLALIPLAPLAFRRGILVIVIAAGLGVSTYPQSAQAGWWATQDQQAVKKFEQNDFTGAAGTFENQAWRATANYRAGQFENVVNDVPDDADVESYYNQGNALVRLGRYEEALAAYDETLSGAADHEDALHNKEIIEQLLEQQQDQQGPQSDSADESEPNDQDATANDQQSDRESSGKPSDSRSQQSADSTEESGESSESSTSVEQESDDQAPLTEAEKSIEEEQPSDAESEAKHAEAQAKANSEIENDQATEQWLRQIPDDPGGLLRRKFEYEFQKKYGGSARRASAW